MAPGVWASRLKVLFLTHAIVQRQLLSDGFRSVLVFMPFWVARHNFSICPTVHRCAAVRHSIPCGATVLFLGGN
jgi:hypothetical protein